jgi:molybdopterin molybdotransferase
MGFAPTQVVDFEAAIRVVLEQAESLPAPSLERVSLSGSLGRVLAQAVKADRDQPGFDRSTRDGFAVRASDWVPGISLRVAGQVRAGDFWRGSPLEPRTAIEIMTGAPVPEGADAVAMVEHSRRSSDAILPLDGCSLVAGENIVWRGSEARAGAEVLPAGIRIGAAEIALAATCGYAEVEVFRRPRVAIVSTGDELVEVDRSPEPHQIRNSNSYAIAAMVTAAGGVAERLPIARDLREEVQDCITLGRKADLLILSGGVSMGEYDLVEEVLGELGAEFFFTGVRMQPGKPVVFGKLPARGAAPACFFFGLPGNPISTQVTFHCFAELLLRALAGEASPAPRWAQATLAENVAGKPGLTRLLPARLDGTAVRVIPWQGSGDLAANARANVYAEFLPGKDYAAGDLIRVLLR